MIAPWFEGWAVLVEQRHNIRATETRLLFDLSFDRLLRCLPVVYVPAGQTPGITARRPGAPPQEQHASLHVFDDGTNGPDAFRLVHERFVAVQSRSQRRRQGGNGRGVSGGHGLSGAAGSYMT